MKLGFVTCVQLGLSCMEAVYEAGGTLEFALTLPDEDALSKSGRVYIDNFCNAHSIPLCKQSHINSPEAVRALKFAKLDWLFIIGWSQIASAEILKLPKFGVLGMHPTLLPEGRGRASIPWAILKGLRKTGVTLFKMDAGIDTGPIAAQVEIPLSFDISATQLYEKVVLAHMQLMRDVVPIIIAGKLQLYKQNDVMASLWPQRKPEDGEIDLTGSVYAADRLIRAVTHPYPGAFFYINNKKYCVWSAKIIAKDAKKHPHLTYLSFKDGDLLIENFEVSIT